MLTFSFAMTIAFVFPKNLSQPLSINTASPICEKSRLSSVSGLRDVRFCLDLLLTTLPFSSMRAQNLTLSSNAKIWSKSLADDSPSPRRANRRPVRPRTRSVIGYRRLIFPCVSLHLLEDLVYLEH